MKMTHIYSILNWVSIEEKSKQVAPKKFAGKKKLNIYKKQIITEACLLSLMNSWVNDFLN